MRHRSKYLALALAPLALLTACGGSAEGQTGQSGGATADGPSGTLTVYTSEPQAKIDEVIAAYNEVNPNVKVEVFRAGTGELKTRIATEKQTGEI
ncbi:hypothetical protein [Arthrobacter crystallopoietes]|uniref:hypothetical protein n=1 Tax=Crystallibacter crystallopoietes TaxID=37928 RepID=UPI001F0EF4B4|nr:hypothetical protein [Arthrobacter crystallopoietes]